MWEIQIFSQKGMKIFIQFTLKLYSPILCNRNAGLFWQALQHCPIILSTVFKSYTHATDIFLNLYYFSSELKTFIYL